MSDLISRQALLNELPHANWGKEWDEALAKAIIESMPTIDQVKHGKWIPCSERLPEGLMAKVLVYAVDSDGLPIIPHVATYDGFTKTWSSSLEIANVEAWMPLPEPYKERREK